eukprot:1140129-Rhodomonas_salina.2
MRTRTFEICGRFVLEPGMRGADRARVSVWRAGVAWGARGLPIGAKPDALHPEPCILDPPL